MAKTEDAHQRYRFLTRRLEDKLDKMIGFFFWKTYVAATLYANISTPINLTITIFTALMTAHSSTSSSFISSEMNMKINLVTFLVSILNSYFTPQKEFNELNEYLIKWSTLGNCFEKCIYTNNTYEEKIANYTKLLDEANNLYKEQYLKKRNFLTDMLHTIVKFTFMDSNDRWMKQGTFDFYEKISECIELDFDLNEFKYNSKKATIFEKICSCFKCCFRCCKRPNVVRQTNQQQDEEQNQEQKDKEEQKNQQNESQPQQTQQKENQAKFELTRSVKNDYQSLIPKPRFKTRSVESVELTTFPETNTDQNAIEKVQDKV